MRIAPVVEIKAKFSAYLKESEKGPVIVTRNGKPVAVLLSVADEDEIERLLLGYSPGLRDILSRSKKAIKTGGGIGHQEFWEDVEAA